MIDSIQQSDEVLPQGGAAQRLPEESVCPVPLAAILYTEELNRRPFRQPDFEAENRSLLALARVLAEAPRSVLQVLADTVTKSLNAGSAGVSLLSKDGQQFFWPAVAGLWQHHMGGGTPRGFSPCGDVLNCNAPLLFKHIEQRYLYLIPVTPRAEECLLVPFHVGGKAVGTLWAIAHDIQRQFDAEDLRQLESLSRIAAAAYQSVAALDAAIEQATFARSLTDDAVRFALEMESLNAELRAGERRFQSVFESIDEGFFIIEKVADEAGKTLDFRFLEANPAFTVLAGDSEIVGKTMRQAFPEPSAEPDNWWLNFDAVLETGVSARFERPLAAQGRLLELHAFRTEGKNYRRIAVICKDIAQRRLAEDALRASEAFSRSIIASSPDCIKVLNLEGNLLSMRSGQELLGIEDIRPFLNKSWVEFWGGEDRNKAMAAIASAAAGETGKFVGFFRTVRGEPKWWDVAISPIFDEHRQPMQLLAISRDVTQRKLIEDSLLQRTYQFETLVNNAPVGIYLVDANFRVRHVNPIGLPEFGEFPDLIGSDFGAVLHSIWEPAQADEMIGRFRHTLATGEAYLAPETIGQRVDREAHAYHEWQINRIPLADGSYGVVCFFRDISERYLAQQRTRENEWRLSYATQSARLTYVEIDLASGVARTPDNFSAVMGYGLPAEQEADGSVGVQMLLDHVMPDDRASVQSALQDFFSGKPVGKLDYRVLGNDGVERWIETRWSVVLGPEGRPLKSFATNTDITDRKQAEEALRASEEQFRATFENVAIGIVHLGLDNRWLRVNPAMCRLTGYTAEALTAMDFTDITHPEDRANNLNQLQRLRAGEIDSYTLEKRYIHQSGRHVWASVSAALLRDAAGLPLYVIGAIEDITEKKATLAQLDVQRRFVERLTHGMPSTLHVYSRAERRNLWVNRHLGDTLGYSARDIALMGQSFLQRVLHEDDVAAMEQHFQRVFASADNDVFDFEYRVRDHAGGWRWLHQSDTVFGRDAQGQVLEVVGTATDVTARKGIEAELIAALAAAEDANHAKSDFLSRMSHELRSPLNAVLGFAQLLQRGSPPPTPLQQEGVTEILKAGWYLLGLIDEILDLALIESGRLSFVLEAVPLVDVLNDCHALVAAQAAQSGIRLSFGPVHDSCRVNADRTRLKQILINLLSNAIKYNRPGGTVQVRCSAAVPGRVRISVQDSGSGMSTEQLAQIFQPFERLGQETGVIAGTGIGLALSKQLVEVMGGRIEVHSTLGQGSVFWVEFDASADLLSTSDQTQQSLDVEAANAAEAGAVGEADGPAPALAPAQAQRQATVLCVEDNPANLVLMRRLLALHGGVRLLVAGDGQQGLQMARTHRPDVVLMDINLPGISGLGAMTELAADVATAHIPVIAISAHAMRHDIERGLQAGFFRYLTKPIKIKTFSEALDAALAFSDASPALNSSKALTP